MKYKYVIIIFLNSTAITSDDNSFINKRIMFRYFV